jgi:FKBP-type peptidyl-prolyl cis-trans isomerase FklB
MIRPVALALCAALTLAACEESGVMAEIEKAEAAIEKQKADAQAKRTASAGPNLEASRAFLAKAEADGGWTKTQSGILWRYVRQNPANLAKPTADAVFLAFYEGKLIDGKVFDSAYSRGEPLSLPVGGVVPGWTELLQLMKPGETIDAIIPPELGYGEEGQGDIGPNQALQFRMELMAFRTPDGKIVGDPRATPRDAPTPPPAPQSAPEAAPAKK